MQEVTRTLDEQLKILMFRFDEYRKVHNDQVIDDYNQRDSIVVDELFNKNYLSSLPDGGYAKVVAKYIRKADASGLFRSMGKEEEIVQYVPAIKKGILYIRDSVDTPYVKFCNLTDPNGQYKIKRIDKSFWTPILQAKLNLPVWNEVTNSFMEIIGSPLKGGKKHSEQEYNKLKVFFIHLDMLSGKESLNYSNHFMKYVVDYEAEATRAVLQS